MKYTFLLPAYKSAFLKSSLQSIASQSFRDFSVIISDDCSPEPLLDIVQPFLEDPRFCYRRNETNIGAEHLVSHWNLLLSLCDSPYLIMASDDDIYEANFLEEIDRLVEQFPDIDLLRCQLDKINEFSETIETESPFDSLQTTQQFSSDIFEKNHLHAIGEYVFKTCALRAAGGFFDLPYAWFSDDATAIIASKNGIAHSSTVLFHARNSGMNISSQKESIHTKEAKGEAIISFYNWFKSYLFSIIKLPHQRKLARHNCRSVCYDRLMNIYAGLPLKMHLKILSSFPFFFWILIKDFLNQWVRPCLHS